MGNPTFLGFYQDAWDEQGKHVKWRPIALGELHDDGSLWTIPVVGPPALTQWRCLADAVYGLQAQVAELEPRRRVDV